MIFEATAEIIETEVDNIDSSAPLRVADEFKNLTALSSSLAEAFTAWQSERNELEARLATEKARCLALAQSEHMLSSQLAGMLDVMPIAVVLLDESGVIAQANPMATTLLGGKIVGQSWLAVITANLSDRPVDGHEMLLKSGRLVSLATQSLPGNAGQVIVVSDLTETRELQRALNHKDKMSQMGRMTASLAHQIRTPLSTALLYAGHLTADNVSADKRQQLAGRLCARLQQLEQQIQDMLLFSRSGIALQQLATVSNLLERMTLQGHELCEVRGAHLCGDNLDPELAGLTVRCHLELLLSAFSNLVENAIQACQEAGIAPRLVLQVQADSASCIRVMLADNGPGLKDQDAETLKQAFVTTKSTGTGLGLAVVDAVAKAHGGEFFIAAGIEQGVVATLRLPITQNSNDNNVRKSR